MRRENPGFESSEFSLRASSLSTGGLQGGGFRAVITHWGGRPLSSQTFTPHLLLVEKDCHHEPPAPRSIGGMVVHCKLDTHRLRKE